MPIDWSTEHPNPNFPENTFGSEATHVKSIYQFLLTDLAYMNPLADDIATMVARIDAVQALLATEMSASLADANTFAGYAAGGGANLPQGWIDATNDQVTGYTSADMSPVSSTVMSYYNNLVALAADLTTLKNYVTVIDLDNFKLHMELTSGVDMEPPPGIIKPNNPALMALVMSLTELENRFGITFTNHFLGMFGTLFTGDVTIAAAQTDLDTDPLSAGTYSPLGIAAGVTKPYVAGATGEDVIWNNPIVAPKVDPLSVPVNAYKVPIIPTHQAALTTHITDDMAYYDLCVHKVNQIVLAYGISSHIQDPYYAYPYVGVFGTPDLNTIIQQYIDGEID